MTDAIAPPTEEQLRGLTRAQIQTLAKLENIKPANAKTETLIRLLNAKYSAERNDPEPRRTKAAKPPKKNVFSLCGLRRSKRLAKAQDSQASNTSVPVETSCRPTDSVRRGKLPAYHRSGAPEPSTSHPSQSAPTPAPALPSASPTHQQLLTITARLHALGHDLANTPSAVHTMGLMIPRLERSARNARGELRTIIWERYYLERDVLTEMKRNPALHDGTNVMPLGPQRDEWMRFLRECDKEFHRLHSEENKKDTASLKRQRADEAEELHGPSKCQKNSDAL